ncbi:HNH endonuclease [Paraburkholderia dipogonis]|uniref:HNH endonuclease n=2 Tax=Paraburkholderia dipogonis TaxID=1211383 RepID=A0A4Y8ML11_9BURK|nr:HNH endonuclease [Paraburkholderia dipogonis]
MDVITTTADELFATLISLGAPVVITKNKHPDSERNYRPRARRPGDMLDGYWVGGPMGVSPGEGFAIHFVERHSRLWLGDYLGVKEREEGSGVYSLIVGNVQCFEITDLNFEDQRQQGLKGILKQNGAVTYSYFDPADLLLDLRSRVIHRYVDTHIDRRDGPAYRTAEIKQRLQQKAFRKAVFDHHRARCVVTGCDVSELLEAAHLNDRCWENGDNGALDGIPLRVDLHRAYDAGLITLDSQHRIVELDERLREVYGQYLRSSDRLPNEAAP